MRRKRAIILVAAVLVLLLLLAFGVVRWTESGAGNNEQHTLVVTREVPVSRLSGPQNETAIAINPRRPNILLAGSNDLHTRRMAVYSSTDGGRHWSATHLPPPPGGGLCGMSDPSVGIDHRGRQYYAFIGLRCISRRLRSPALYLARRDGASKRWTTLQRPVAHSDRLALGDDRPMLLVDNVVGSPHRGRVYLSWTRFSVNPNALDDPEDTDLVGASALVSHSDSGGRRWSPPYSLSSKGAPLEVSLAAAPSGALYAAWRDSKTNAVYLARSADGVTFGSQAFVAGAVVIAGRSCHRFRALIPAQPRRCVAPNPLVLVDTTSGSRRGRVYVTYGSTALNRSQDVYIAAFQPDLRPLVRFPKPVSPPEGFRGPDQFLPASALDPRTGALWVCYYQSLGRMRRRARYVCTASNNGGKSWMQPRVVAHALSNETAKRAERRNGYGDYEGVAVLGGLAHAIWTDGRDLRRWGEEIFVATLTQRTR